MPLRHIEDFCSFVRRKDKIVAVALGEDHHILEALERGSSQDLFNVINFARRDRVNDISNKYNIDTSRFKIIEASSEEDAVALAVKAVRDGKADVLVKGSCSSAEYLRGILNKTSGLVPEGNLLSHAIVLDIPKYHKLLIASDVAVIPFPTLDEKICEIKYCVAIANQLGIPIPRVSIVAACEKASSLTKAMVDGAILSKMNERGQIRDCIIDGPLSLGCSISKDSRVTERVGYTITGDADILIFPDIETGNTVVKALKHLCNTISCGVLAGTTAPCVLTSRGDSTETKLYSIVFGVLLSLQEAL